MVTAVNNLVQKDELVAWSRMKEERRERTITKLLHTVEESALTLANNYKSQTELEIKASEMGEIIIRNRALLQTEIILNRSAICSHRGFSSVVSLTCSLLDRRIETFHL